MVMLRMSVRVNGLTALAVTKLDVLGGLDRIKVCVGYRHNGKATKEFPASMRILSECEPTYREFKGWVDLAEADWISLAKKGKQALPAALRTYLGFIEAQLGIRVRIASVGRPRSATIGR
jgi:adenylosuccinate synthase